MSLCESEALDHFTIFAYLISVPLCEPYFHNALSVNWFHFKIFVGLLSEVTQFAHCAAELFQCSPEFV